MFVPANFDVPAILETARFRLRMLSAADAELDYDAVMSSRDHLHHVFAPNDDWPAGDMTLEQNRADLVAHEADFVARRAFAYTVVTPDEQRCLGCVYIYPARRLPYDAQVYLWVRASELPNGLDAELFSIIQTWLREHWPFRKVAFPGRSIDWQTWQQLPVQDEPDAD